MISDQHSKLQEAGTAATNHDRKFGGKGGELVHCGNCGAQVSDTARFCTECGQQLGIAPTGKAKGSDGDAVSAATLLGMAKTAEIGGNNSEALGYFNRVLEIDPTNSEAWIGKGKAAAWQSTLANIRLKEALISFQHAVANAPADQKVGVTEEVLSQVNAVVVALYGIARNHMIEFVSLDNTWPQYLNQVAQLLDVLNDASKWSQHHRITLDNIIHLCKDNIEGYSYRDRLNNNWPCVHSINPEYEKSLREMMDQAAASIRESDTSYSLPSVVKKEKDACFIVTATMGDFNHPDVVYLRLFRDEWLRKRVLGRIFIAVYYRIGPSLAFLIDQSEILRQASRRFIVQPAIRAAARRLPRG